MPKAQSAMEYLMTYGWAILILAVVLGALYSLGLFSPSSFISNQCIMPADFSCLSGVLGTDGNFVVNIQQATTGPLNITATGCNAEGTITSMNTITPAIYMPIGSNTTFTVQCLANGTVFTSTPGTLFRGYLIVNYTDVQTGFTHVVIGNLVEKS